MPMLAGYERIREEVKEAIDLSELRMERLEVEISDPDWLCWAADSLRQATLVIVDVTDNNPFVMYELGLAHAARLPIIYIVDERNTHVPAIISGSPYIPYNTLDLSETRKTLRDEITAIHSRASKRKPIAITETQFDSITAKTIQCLEDFERSNPGFIPRSDPEFIRSSIRLGLRRGEFDDAEMDPAHWTILVLSRAIGNSGQISVMKTIRRYSSSEHRQNAP